MHAFTGRTPSLPASRAPLAVTGALLCALLACNPLDESPAQPTLVIISLPSGAAARFDSLGATLQLSAVVADANGKRLTGAGVDWSTSDAAVADVSAAGLVTAVGNGTATLTGRSGSARGSIGVVVQQAPSTVAVVPAEATIERGATQSFTATATDPGGKAIAGATFAWTSSAPATATVDSGGTATGNAAGDAVITATSGGLTGHATLQVTVPGVAAVVIDEATPPALARIGATLQLHARALDARNQPVPEAQPGWRSDAAAVASVDASGLVTAVANGQATITASAGGQSASLRITVAQAVDHLALAVHGGGGASLTAIGDTLRLDAVALDGGGTPVGGVAFSWAACDGGAVSAGCASTVVSVDSSGLVTAAGNGTATVRVSGGGGAAALGVGVAQRIAAVSVSPSFDTIAPGKTRQFTAQATDANGHPLGPSPAFAWSSSKPAVAAVDQAGLATAPASVASADTTTLRAAASDAGGDHAGEATLTVDPTFVPIDHVVVTPAGSTALASLGATLGLTASARDASDQPIANVAFAWSSSAPIVASVTPSAPGSASATVQALASGSATVRADAGGMSGTVAISVAQQVSTVAAPTAGTALALSAVGQTLQLAAKDSGGAAIASGASWTACDGSAAPPCAASTVASVDGGGKVTALKNGSARITAATSAASAFADVAVAQQVSSVDAGGASTTLTGAGQTLQLHALDAKGNAVDAATVTWSSGNLAAATVDGAGLVTAVDDGAAAIQAKTALDDGKSLGVTVARRVGTVETTTAGASTTLVSLGDTLQLRARDTSGALLGAGLDWSTGNAQVATVGASGLVTAAGNGSTTIRAKRGSGDTGSTLGVTVSQRVAQVAPASPATLESLGDFVQLSALDGGGNPVAGATWSACAGATTPSPPSPCAAGWVTVDSSGKATAQSNGTGRVYAERGGGTGFSDLTVAQKVAGVSVGPGSTTIAVNGTVRFGATAVDARSQPVSGAPAASWSSSNDAIATIDSGGNATGKAEGSATITATIASKTGTAMLTVSNGGY